MRRRRRRFWGSLPARLRAGPPRVEGAKSRLGLRNGLKARFRGLDPRDKWLELGLPLSGFSKLRHRAARARGMGRRGEVRPIRRRASRSCRRRCPSRGGSRRWPGCPRPSSSCGCRGRRARDRGRRCRLSIRSYCSSGLRECSRLRLASMFTWRRPGAQGAGVAAAGAEQDDLGDVAEVEADAAAVGAAVLADLVPDEVRLVLEAPGFEDAEAVGKERVRDPEVAVGGAGEVVGERERAESPRRSGSGSG